MGVWKPDTGLAVTQAAEDAARRSSSQLSEQEYTNELLKENNLLLRALLEHLQAPAPRFVAEHPEVVHQRKLAEERAARKSGRRR